MTAKIYGIRVPILGYAFVEVKASNKQDAIQQAIEDVDLSDFQSWNAVEQVVMGNVFMGDINEPEIDYEEDDDEDEE